MIISENPKDPYVQQWSLGAQRSLTSNTIFELNYVGSKGTNLLMRRNIAQAFPYTPDHPSVQERKPFPNFGVYINSDWSGYSNYNALNAKLEHRARSSLVTLAYTWAKSTDSKSAAAGIGASGFNGWQGFLNNHDPQRDHGLSDFDVDHRLVGSFVYNLPFGKGEKFATDATGVKNAVVGGWQVNGIYTWQRGFPITVTAQDLGGVLDTFGTNRANLVGDPNPSGFNPSIDQWFNTAAFAQPALGQFGSVGTQHDARAEHQQPGLRALQEFRLAEEHEDPIPNRVVQLLQPPAVQCARHERHFAAVRRDRVGQAWTHQPAWAEVYILSDCVRGRKGRHRRLPPRRCALCRMSTARTEADVRIHAEEVCGRRLDDSSLRAARTVVARARPPRADAHQRARGCRSRMPSVPSLRGDTTRRSGCIATSLRQMPGCRRGACEARRHLLPGVEVRRGDPRAAARARAQARTAQSRRAARDVTVGGGAARRGASGSQAGLRAWGGCAVGAARRPSPAARLHGPRARRGRRGRRLELTRRYPDDPEVLYHAGRLFSNYAYLQTMKLQRVAPDSVWMHQAAGEANESQGLWDAAIREYGEVLAAAPNRPGLHFRIGRVLLAQASQPGGDAPALTARAREQFELELQRDPTNANAAYELGELQRRAGELEKAVASFGAAVHSDPGFPDALVGLGRTLTTLNRASEAVPLLERATTLDPGSDVAFYLLSQAYGAAGNAVAQQRALETFTKLRAQKRGTGSIGEGRPDVTKQDLPGVPRGGEREKE